MSYCHNPLGCWISLSVSGFATESRLRFLRENKMEIHLGAANYAAELQN
jgi:hypothetical protein